MEPKRTKYDTNPLDGRVADRAHKSFERNRAGGATEDIAGATHRIAGSNSETSAQIEQEAPTRRIDDKVTSYPSIFIPPAPRAFAAYEPPRVQSADIYQPPPALPPNIYQPPPLPLNYKPGSKKVSGIGIPERWALILPYLPFWLAIVAAVAELLLVPRTESKVRFHAAQGMALQVIITAITTILTFAGLATGRWTGSGLFQLASSIFLIIGIIRVWKGKPFHVAPLDEVTKWLDEKIKPRK
ncbi:MAG: hypothetical protein ABR607_15230 [Pyrinomonadaceae bacterium]